MALISVDRLTFAYPGAEPALRDVSLTIERGEIVLLLGRSGSGKSTLLRALAGLVPHFHGGRFEGRVEVAGLDTRRHRPAELAGTAAIVFQDPEDQIVMTHAESEVAFGLENLGAAPATILPRAHAALAAVGIGHLAGRALATVSGGELQRVCLASAAALEPEVLLLDEPTSQLDPEGADRFLDAALAAGRTVVLSEQRPDRVLDRVGRIVFLEEGRIAFDLPAEAGIARLPSAWRGPGPPPASEPVGGEEVCSLRDVRFAYGDGPPAVEHAQLTLRRGEIVALAGPNGSGKTTLGKLAAGLLSPQAGEARLRGRAAFLLQDPGRYVVRDRCDDEVALTAGRDGALAALAAVGLAGKAAANPRDLSSGERERLALAAVLAARPDLIVLDEPTRGVDPERKAELAELLRAQAGGRATLVITHDAVFAAEVADQTVSLAAGRPREAVLA